MLEINMDDVYEIKSTGNNLMQFSFSSPTLGGEYALMIVVIKAAENDFFEEFLNLSFGPRVNGEIDDMIVVQHAKPFQGAFDSSSMCVKFLNREPNRTCRHQRI